MALTQIPQGMLSSDLQNSTPAFKNRIINGAMVIDQRNAGASVTPANGTYSLDRWMAICYQPSKFSVQQNAGSVTPPPGFSSYLGVTSLSAYTVGTSEYFAVLQRIEGYNIADLGWGTANAQTVTLSFWVRSSLTGTFGGTILAGLAVRSYTFSYNIPVANTWTQISVTIPGDINGPGAYSTTNANGITVCFGLGAGSGFSSIAGTWSGTQYQQPPGTVSVVGTSGATFYVTGVQLEKGSVATAFDNRDYGRELALCQRYYQRSTAESVVGTFVTGIICSGITAGNGPFQLMSPMRATPTLDSSAANTFNFSDGALGTACTTVTLAGAQSNSRMASLNFATAGGLTQYRPYRIEANGVASAYLGFSAEL